MEKLPAGLVNVAVATTVASIVLTLTATIAGLLAPTESRNNKGYSSLSGSLEEWIVCFVSGCAVLLWNSCNPCY
jgi:hypothetical protein